MLDQFLGNPDGNGGGECRWTAERVLTTCKTRLRWAVVIPAE